MVGSKTLPPSRWHPGLGPQWAGSRAAAPYSRCWGVRGAAEPRSPSSRSFCRSGKQSPHRSVTSTARATMQLLMGPFPPQQQNSPKTLQKRSLPRSQPKPWAPAANVPVPIPIPVPRMLLERIRAPSPLHPRGHSPSSSVFWRRTGRPCPSPRSCTPRRWLPWQDRGFVRQPGCSRDRGAPLVPQPCHKILSFASAGSWARSPPHQFQLSR